MILNLVLAPPSSHEGYSTAQSVLVLMSRVLWKSKTTSRWNCAVHTNGSLCSLSGVSVIPLAQEFDGEHQKDHPAWPHVSLSWGSNMFKQITLPNSHQLHGHWPFVAFSFQHMEQDRLVALSCPGRIGAAFYLKNTRPNLIAGMARGATKAQNKYTLPCCTLSIITQHYTAVYLQRALTSNYNTKNLKKNNSPT